ncbi:CaiB/BaiF CoA transferase family protein [Alkalibacillus salilacus]|uniref:Crotonobetainyl-CoA:carnitine CoA-transferase CaiB-like acyl-CoA transferase n=1 Tax=Alkalibacillus salilacus TaxID=284582 RepID=A0ABT9VB25_9BACI|nr:CaiB/BaiF CoA-transferase family protein [Alkalibacillus salilacus]MDQ0158156.1 crotonobetainyl-CoA:carnitine CoA-transferase CaiB-like acyl-CoA transferase [Alkalibacillus salilacus]
MTATLEGLKVVELGNFIAGPFASKIFAEFGADVIKIESPEKGDPLREWRHVYEGRSLWWRLQSRNKKSLTVNMKEEEGQEVVKNLIKEADIVIENFKPGTLEKWGLSYENLKEINPGIIMVRISGYGQTGPYKDKAGFGSVGESMGGIRYVTGHPELPPPRVGISLGDQITAMYAVVGAMFAVYHRDVLDTGEGQMIDVALYESVFSLMEGMLPEYEKFGAIRERQGTSLPGVAPSNTYQCKDNKYIVIGGNGDKIFKRLMNAIGREDVANDERFQNNNGRAAEADYLDEVIQAWTDTVDLNEAMDVLDKASVPAGPIYNIEDIVNDPQYQARQMFEEHQLNDEENIRLPGIVPKMSKTPGTTKWLGPDLGAHNEDVLSNILGMSSKEIKAYKDKGII